MQTLEGQALFERLMRHRDLMTLGVDMTTHHAHTAHVQARAREILEEQMSLLEFIDYEQASRVRELVERIVRVAWEPPDTRLLGVTCAQLDAWEEELLERISQERHGRAAAALATSTRRKLALARAMLACCLSALAVLVAGLMRWHLPPPVSQPMPVAVNPSRATEPPATTTGRCDEQTRSSRKQKNTTRRAKRTPRPRICRGCAYPPRRLPTQAPTTF